MDIRQRAFKIIESVQARVVGISDNQVQLNKSQCQFLASKLLDIKPFLRENEEHLKSSRHAAHLHFLNTMTQAENLIRRCCCEHSITWPEVAFGAAEIKGDLVEVLLDVCWWQSLSHIAIATQVKSLPEEGALELLKTAEEDYVRLSKSLHSKHSELQVAAKSDNSEFLSTLVQLVKEVATRAGKEQDGTHKSTLAVQLCSRFNLKVEDIEPSLNINQEAMMESRLNDYKDPKTIRQGSFGVVLKVRYFGRPCALKVFKGIYKEEATLLRGLQHPHIVQFYRYWEAPYTSEQAHSINRSHLLMELMSTNLTEHIAAQRKMNRSQPSSSTSSVTRSTQTISMPFPLPVAIDIMLQVARAMEYLHGKNIAHRDLKTDNVLVRPLCGILELCEFGYVDVKLADFGLAKGDCQSSTGHQQTPNRGKYLVFVFTNGNMDIGLLKCRQMHHGVGNLPGNLSPLFWRLGPGL